MCIEKFELEENFWKVYPELRFPKAFSKLYNADESDDRNESSITMWALALVYSYKSTYRGLTEKDRKDLVEKDFLKMEGFFNEHSKQLQPVIDQLMFLQKDSELRYLDIWSRKMDQITEVLDVTQVTLSNMEDMTKHMLGHEKLLQAKDKILERVAKKDVKNNVRGGGKTSLLEADEI